MLVQLAAHIFVLVALKLFLNSLLYNFLIIILKFSIIKKKKFSAQLLNIKHEFSQQNLKI